MEITKDLRHKIDDYQPSREAVELVKRSKLLLVAGTAGSGKNTIIQRLLKNDDYSYIVSHTTRSPRPGEHHGRNYYFTDIATMAGMIDDKRFVEVKLVHQNHIYGTSIDELSRVEQAGKVGITDIEVQGVAEYVKLAPGIKAVFLLPPSHDEWMRRLAQRGEQDQDDILRRLQTAEHELEHALEIGHFHFVVNLSLDKAVADVKHFVETGDYQGDDEDKRVEHAWHVLGELKKQLSS